MADLSAQKADLRKQAALARDRAHAKHAAHAPDLVANRVVEVLSTRPGGIVSGFYPYLSELDIRPTLSRLVQCGWRSALPIVVGNGKPLTFRVWAPGDDTVPGAYDIPVPPEHCKVVTPDVMLVPFLAFDADGYRLGYGGGFYDRTIAKARREGQLIAIGVAYSGQQVKSVPRDTFDEALDWIVTETETIQTGSRERL